jgi:hypothetical protein
MASGVSCSGTPLYIVNFRELASSKLSNMLTICLKHNPIIFILKIFGDKS